MSLAWVLLTAWYQKETSSVEWFSQGATLFLKRGNLYSRLNDLIFQVEGPGGLVSQISRFHCTCLRFPSCKMLQCCILRHAVARANPSTNARRGIQTNYWPRRLAQKTFLVACRGVLDGSPLTYKTMENLRREVLKLVFPS